MMVNVFFEMSCKFLYMPMFSWGVGRGRRKVGFIECADQERASTVKTGPGFCASGPAASRACSYFMSGRLTELLQCVYWSV